MYYCKNVPRNKKRICYSGNEKSPKGRGLAAKYADPTNIYRGKDKKLWQVKKKENGSFYWSRSRSKHYSLMKGGSDYIELDDFLDYVISKPLDCNITFMAYIGQIKKKDISQYKYFEGNALFLLCCLGNELPKDRVTRLKIDRIFCISKTIIYDEIPTIFYIINTDIDDYIMMENEKLLGNTYLHAACHCHSIYIASKIIDSCVDLKNITCLNEANESPLYTACEHQNFEIANKIISKIEELCINDDCIIKDHLILSDKNPLEILIEKYSNNEDEKADFIKLAKKLIEYHGIIIYPNTLESNPFLLSIRNKIPELVEYYYTNKLVNKRNISTKIFEHVRDPQTLKIICEKSCIFFAPPNGKDILNSLIENLEISSKKINTHHQPPTDDEKSLLQDALTAFFNKVPLDIKDINQSLDNAIADSNPKFEIIKILYDKVSKDISKDISKDNNTYKNFEVSFFNKICKKESLINLAIEIFKKNDKLQMQIEQGFINMLMKVSRIYILANIKFSNKFLYFNDRETTEAMTEAMTTEMTQMPNCDETDNKIIVFNNNDDKKCKHIDDKKCKHIDDKILYTNYGFINENNSILFFKTSNSIVALDINTDKNIYNTYVPSNELNLRIIDLIFDGDPLSDILFTRLTTFMKFFINKNKTTQSGVEEKFYVFHGTTQKIHQDNNTFCTLTFLSTTTDKNVAINYANSGDISYIYVIQIGNSHYSQIVKFNDNLSQIVLPIGSVITVTKTFSYDKTVYYICTLDEINDLSKTLNAYTCLNKKIIFKNLIIPAVKIFKVENQTNYVGSSEIIRTYVKHGCKDEPYIIKSITKGEIDYTNNQLFRRILNEILASSIYRAVYNLETFIYGIFNYQNKYYIGSIEQTGINYEYNRDRQDRQDYIHGFLVDCILGNWDAYNNKNIGFYKGRIIRTDVGGALFYRGRGDRRFNFNSKEDPQDHLIFFKQEFFIRNFVKYFTTESMKKMITTIQKTCIRTALKRAALPIYMIIENATIKNQELNKIYTDFINNILNTVEFRHNYYVDNIIIIIKEIKNKIDIMNPPDGKKGGSRVKKIDKIAPAVAVAVVAATTMKQKPEPVSETAFVSPDVFKQIIGQSRCHCL